MDKILEHHILFYFTSIQKFTQYLADMYIQDKHQKEIFLRKDVWLKIKFNYIAGLILTENGQEIFTPAYIREIVSTQILPSLSEISDSQLAGLLLTQDVHTTAKTEYNNGYPCLLKINRGNYKFVGFS